MFKRGGERILSVWWFLILVIVGASIVSAVAMFYSADINVNEVEAEVLSERIFNCLNENGFISDGFLETDFDIYTRCGFSKEIIENSGFYFKIDLLGKDSSLEKRIKGGDSSFEADCEVSESKKISARYYPSCKTAVEKILYVKDGKIAEGKIEVLSAVNQRGGA